MASKTMQEHELKIMDVEGAVTVCQEPVMTVDVDDDSAGDEDNNNVSLMLAELETSLNEKDIERLVDPLMEESMSAKIEPSEEEADFNPYHDPMGLLSRIDSNPENDSQDDDDDDVSADDLSSEVVSKPRKPTPAERWQIYMKRWPWLLHEDSDGTYAYCLYCNVNLNVSGKTKFIKQHNLCMYHQEREKNYLTFKEGEAKKKDDNQEDDEVKHEFGTNSYVAAMKKKRESQVEAFNNFNWQHWLQEHTWLKRTEPQGTIGFCKICSVSMNVEFIYLRKRHEASKAHLQNLRQQGKEKPAQKRKRSLSTSCDEVSQSNQENVDTTLPLVSIAGGEIEAGSDPSAWCEFIPGTKYQQCRCTLCNIRMVVTSFLRHCKTKAHCTNLQNQNSGSGANKDGVWSMYKDIHPWLVADPEDASIAYCNVCCKRFIYGHSELKRKAHENSEKHLSAVAANAAEVASKKTADVALQSERAQTETDERADEVNEDDDDNDEDYEEEEEDASTSHQSSRGRTIRVKSKQVVRHYPWLCLSRDRKVQLCKFCRVRFRSESAKARHELSDRHKSLVKQFHKRKYARRIELRAIRNQQNAQEKMEVDEDKGNKHPAIVDQKPIIVNPVVHPKSLPSTIRGKVLIWKERFPWLSYKRSEMRPNYGWCKLCEVSVFMPSFKFASKHQRTTKHIRLRIERKKLALQDGEANNPIASILPTGEAKHNAAMAELQAKYDWLEPDTSEENYCHCRVCDTRLPIKVFFLRQHDTSRKHSDNLQRLNLDNARNTSVADGEDQPQQQRTLEAAPGLDHDRDSDEALSQRSDTSTGEPPLKRSRRSNEVRRIIRALRESVGKRQDDRNQLELAKDMICSSFDIVTRLRELERTHLPPAMEPAASTPSKNIEPLCIEPRHVMDLFLDSISATMKELPSDLAAKGKAKIMQIVCDLEVEAMQRKAPVAEPQPVSPQPTESMSIEVSNSQSKSPDMISCSETLEDEDLNDDPVGKMINNVNTSQIFKATAKLPEISLMSQRRTARNSSTIQLKTTSTPTRATTNHNGSKEAQPGVRRAIPLAIQVTKVRPDVSTQDAVRCVPLDQLTIAHRSNGSTANKSNNSNNNVNNSSSYLRNFRVSNGNATTGPSPNSKPTQIMLRLNSSGGHPGGSLTSNGVSQSSQAQYQRTQNTNQRMNSNSR